MIKHAILCLSVALATHVVRAESASNTPDNNWGQWRGPLATGAAPGAKPPIEWSESKNIRWKVEIPGRGHASPIIWGDRVFVQTAVKTDREPEPAAEEKAEAERVRELNEAPPWDPNRKSRLERLEKDGKEVAAASRRGRNRRGGNQPTHFHEFAMLALDRDTGKSIWKKTLCDEVPHEGGHPDASQASNSPVTDGTHLFGYFGSRGLYAMTMEGEIIWKTDFGQMTTRNGFGEGSSPALHGDTLVVTWDHEGESFIVALDKKTGQERWRRDRDEATSWATPIVVEANGKAQVVTSATNFVRSYDLAKGELLWQCNGMTANPTPSPMRHEDLVIAISGFRGGAIRAIRFAEAAGDISESAALEWKYDGKGAPYIPSALIYDGGLYFLDNTRAILSNFDAATGKQHYTQQRLDGVEGVYASIVGAAERIYIAGRNGATAVVKHGPEFKLLATNKLDESFSASPAIVGDAIFLRGDKYLYCIAEN